MSTDGALSLALDGQPLAVIPNGSMALLGNQQFGASARHLFMALIQIEP
jgi:hypothetical protein